VAAVESSGWRGPVTTVAVVGIAAALVSWWGHSVVGPDPGLHVQAPPFVGAWRLIAPTPRFLVPVTIAIVVIAVGPQVGQRLRWGAVLVATSACSLAWTVSLAATSGWAALSAPLATRYEYLLAVPRVGSPLSFLRTFVAEVPTYPTHVQGHPPGMVLLLWVLDQLGLGGAGWATALVLTVAASGASAVLLAVDDVAGRTTARRLAPFLVLVPAAVWTATSADALFAGVGAWAVALGVLASSPVQSPRRRWALTAAAGVLFGAVAMLSYGLVLLGLVPLGVAARRHQLLPIVVVGVTAGALVIGVAASGFWWFDGLAATRRQQLAGIDPSRPYGYFVFSNLAAFALALGPAAVGGLALVRRHRLAALVLGGAVAVTVADLTGFSKGEVERIWLPFVPWLLVGAARLTRPRAWLAACATSALLIQLFLLSPW